MDAENRLFWETYEVFDCYVDIEAAAEAFRRLPPTQVTTAAVLKILIEYSNNCPKNRCVQCGVDMGEMNPRQLCGKTYCENS
jgi:histone acetyltransferase (RNA polymerase elongator complex component)